LERLGAKSGAKSPKSPKVPKKIRNILNYYKTMKSILKYMLMTLLAGCLSAACSKDDGGDGDSSKNAVQYNGREYQIESSSMMVYGDIYENDTQNYGIRLYVNRENEEAFEISILIGDLTFPEGTISYSYSESHRAGTMDGFFYRIGDDRSDENGKLSSGSATITKNGLVYEISFSVKTADGKTITGHHKQVDS
jgi:predicted heme/steroid binding protein